MASRRTDWRGGAAYADRDGESDGCVGALEANVDDGGALGLQGEAAGAALARERLRVRAGRLERENCMLDKMR
jgi:hypothetical protein